MTVWGSNDIILPPDALVHINSYALLSGLFAAMYFIYMAALVLILGSEVNRVVSLLRVEKG
jgi:uncharacterized BrkB/YihY/UPF0761 family membrane protein